MLSPSRLKPKTTTKIAKPGKRAIQGALSKYSREELSILPQLGAGGCWPRPRKERLASATIAIAVVKTICTIKGLMAFGAIWKISILSEVAPAARALVT